MIDHRKSLDATAVSLMVVLTFCWGMQQVAIKLAAHEISWVAQAAIRSAVATLLLWGWARWRGIALFERDGTLWPGVLAGVLFGAEFGFIYAGLEHTSASRMIVFFYFAPVATAVGLALRVPGERLNALQWLGVLASFAGIVVAFGEGLFAGGGETWRGDLLGLAGAIAWAVTTVLIRATGLARIAATKTLFYQLGVSALLLPFVSLAMGEPGITGFGPVTFWSLAFQCVVVAFGAYLGWFWLLRHYVAQQVSIFSFLTPLFGVLGGVAVLGDPLTLWFMLAALLVGAGILLVNLAARRPG